MDALDVISLEDAKQFLVVDFPEKDNEITRHIKSAVSIVERYTNYILYNRNSTYNILSTGKLEIYDYPISLPAGTLIEQRTLSIIVKAAPNSQLPATIGYTDVTLIPENLIDACYKVITYLFENKDIYPADLPGDVQLLLNQWRRNASI